MLDLSDFTSDATRVGVFAIFALMVLERVLHYLKTRRVDEFHLETHDEHRQMIAAFGKITDRLERLDRMLEELYKWHNQTDENGVRSWYTPRSVKHDLAEIRDDVKEVRRRIEEFVR